MPDRDKVREILNNSLQREKRQKSDDYKERKSFQEDGSYKVTDLYVENGRIVASADEVTDKTQLDASGLKILPGLVDIHSHGAVRHDFSDADVDGLRTILQYENLRESHPIARHP